MSGRLVRRLGDGSVRVDVRYHDANGERTRRAFTDPCEADAFEAVVGWAIRRWPLQPLLVRCQLDTVAFARRHGLNPRAVATAMGNGLSDLQADTWAIRAGWHPLEVWGWAWVEAGLAFGPLDPQRPDPVTFVHGSVAPAVVGVIDQHKEVG